MAYYKTTLSKMFHFFVLILVCISFYQFSVKVHIFEYLIAMFILLLYVISSKKMDIDKQENTELKIWIVTFITRMLWCIYVDNKITQVSDFSVAIKTAITGKWSENANYYRSYAHKIYYPVILHALKLDSQTKILVFQCFVLAFCSVIIYKLSHRIYGSRKAGVISSVIYICWPAQVVYTGIVTEEHVAMLVMLISVYGCIELADKVNIEIKNRKQLLAFVVNILCLGIAFGISCFFKDWGAVILVAAFVYVFYQFFVAILEGNKKRGVLLIVAYLTVLFIRMIVSGLMLDNAERIVGIPVANNVVVAQVFSALDPSTEGTYNAEKNKEFQKIVEKNNYDYSKANKEALSILRDNIWLNREKLIPFFEKKGIRAYSDDGSMLWWGINASAKNEEIIEQFSGLIDIIVHWSRLYYCIIVCAMLISGWINDSEYKSFLLLVILGAVLVSLIVESQGRYKYSIEPLWCVVASGFFVNEKLKSYRLNIVQKCADSLNLSTVHPPKKAV